MRALTRTLPLALTALLAAAGCGGSATTREPASFKVTLDDYLIRPQKLRVPKGEPLTVTVHNIGRLGHTFRIRSATHNVMNLTTIPPNGTKSRTFKLAAGTYTMYCALSNHEELGMSGTLVVG
ncbi:cupredoxin domain-containing protein [Candidatus Solirubrobacter pratensis]|uniref:cupredoxin domain-containing protein n=1 Tax=Candidatus Solirubrobacter pratensis TaxID=1298857 RepID=UPI000406CA3B|nr:cupredoxin domain-containing protein [Candidatus Solirubrobacter pratensis]